MSYYLEVTNVIIRMHTVREIIPGIIEANTIILQLYQYCYYCKHQRISHTIFAQSFCMKSGMRLSVKTSGLLDSSTPSSDEYQRKIKHMSKLGFQTTGINRAKIIGTL